MTRTQKTIASVFALVLLPLTAMHAQTAGKTELLPATEVARVMPAQVWFHNQFANTQQRNSAAVRFQDGSLVEAALVDTGGYSTAVRETYQFYLLTDSSLRVGDKELAPGAYGCGFLPDRGFLVMDLGAHEMWHVPVVHDNAMARPRPLQMTVEPGNGELRLYVGRDYVALRRK